MRRFSQSIGRRDARVYDLRATIDGEARYFIVEVPLARQRAFEAAVEDDAGFDLEPYGVILHRGWDAPDDALKRRLHERYGLYPEP